MVWFLFHEYLDSGPVLNPFCFSPFNKADCEAINGYLVEVNSKQEADFVLANIIRKFLSTDNIYMAPWQKFAVS